MPMYEYRCLACDSRFERLRRMDQGDTDVLCPACQSALVERRVSVFAAHTRGAGAVASEVPVTASTAGCCGGACGCGSRN